MSSTPANYSFYAVPLAWIVSQSAHIYAAALSKHPDFKGEFDNCSPREYLAKVRALKQTPNTQKYLRAEATQMNGFENLAFFCAAIVAGNAARLPVSTMNTFAASYILSRLAYSFLYIFTNNPVLSGLRSVAFLAGVIPTLTIFVKAGNAFDKLRYLAL